MSLKDSLLFFLRTNILRYRDK